MEEIEEGLSSQYYFRRLLKQRIDERVKQIVALVRPFTEEELQIHSVESEIDAIEHRLSFMKYQDQKNVRKGRKDKNGIL